MILATFRRSGTLPSEIDKLMIVMVSPSVISFFTNFMTSIKNFSGVNFLLLSLSISLPTSTRFVGLRKIETGVGFFRQSLNDFLIEGILSERLFPMSAK